MTTHIDHADYQKRLRDKTYDELHFIIRDAKAAHDVNPEGHKAGYYLDEIHYCYMEMDRRDRLANARHANNLRKYGCEV